MSEDDECYCKQCLEYSRIIRKLPNLFLKKAQAFRPKGEVNSNIGQLFAITINLSPFKLMNKKRWFTYSHDKQQSILTRLENKFRQLTPSIKLQKLVFEIAPAVNNCDTFRNIHIHALYQMPEMYVSEMETYYNRICNDPTNNWKHLKIDKVFNEKGWIDYISKDIKIA